MTKEIMEDNYMMALLRAALLLGDLHRTIPVHEITISGFRLHNSIRKLYPRCRILARTDFLPYSTGAVNLSPCSVDYLILYPLRTPKSIPS